MTRSQSTRNTAPRSVALAFVGSTITLVVVFAVVHLLAEKVVSGRYPAPEQAAVWSMIGWFVAGTAAVAAAAQAWWLIRRK
jgi:hypothetical protein